MSKSAFQDLYKTLDNLTENYTGEDPDIVNLLNLYDDFKAQKKNHTSSPKIVALFHIEKETPLSIEYSKAYTAASDQDKAEFLDLFMESMEHEYNNVCDRLEENTASLYSIGN